MSTQVERVGKEEGEALPVPASDEAQRPRHEAEDTGAGLLKAVLARDNMQQAWKRVRSNKGAAGIDGLSIDETAERLRWEWPSIREQLLQGTYRPQPVRRVTISATECGEEGWSAAARRWRQGVERRACCFFRPTPQLGGLLAKPAKLSVKLAGGLRRNNYVLV